MATDQQLDLSPPEEITRPLWKSLVRNFRDRFLPDNLPPLYITSRPVNLGMLLGDFLSLPWYRTVFTNLGAVISPETQPTLPPLDPAAVAFVHDLEVDMRRDLRRSRRRERFLAFVFAAEVIALMVGYLW